jgi:predicted MFS family arabinose efflux permease
VFLGGCIATSLVAYWSPSLSILFAAMFAMGCFASIYHPVGLSLISRVTTPENRPAALGWHGILGSIGIAVAPLLAAIVFGTTGIGWREYYVVLCVPAAIVGLLIFVTLSSNGSRHQSSPSISSNASMPEPETFQRSTFYRLVAVGALAGFVYAAFLHFLARYLNDSGIRPSSMTPESFRTLVAALVLSFGIIGQAVAGRMARAGHLERFLALIMFGNVPCLLWMALADGPWRITAACATALVHFMSQPVYNSLIAQYVPANRRSVGYGFSNMVCFGIGALGPTFAGLLKSDLQTYGGMAVVIAAAGCLALGLNRRRVE